MPVHSPDIYIGIIFLRRKKKNAECRRSTRDTSEHVRKVADFKVLIFLLLYFILSIYIFTIFPLPAVCTILKIFAS